MLYTLKNQQLQVTVSEIGAELQSIQTPDGREYLWQGDPTYWKDRALNIFPYVAIPTEGMCTYKGKAYPMPEHGFAPISRFCLRRQEDGVLELELTDNEQTRSQYPFRFSFAVGYELCGARLEVTYRVRNKSEETMFFGIGGHPGFRLPLTKDTCFEDYYMEFSEPCKPWRVGFTESFFVNGCDTPFPLEMGRRLPLRHELFDHDAVILRHMAKAVTLKSDKTDLSVTVAYPQMNYLGFWHTNCSQAPFVCIEPWTSLPSRDGIVEDLACQSDLVALPTGETYTNTWSITIGENYEEK
ncbi:MAG: aldose 1-epimerase family protein [Clostridia bacterium]|nr:aldose 1-epimerase family protein [Clostridia bacterium]